MFLPRYFKHKFGYKIFEANNIINGRDSKNYKIKKGKLEFIHIPKTAGSSIKELFIDREWVDPDDDVHRPVSKCYPSHKNKHHTNCPNTYEKSMIENINKVDSAVYDHFSKLTPHQRLFKLKDYILEKSGKHPS